MAAKYLGLNPGCRVLQVGSGGGFEGFAAGNYYIKLRRRTCFGSEKFRRRQKLNNAVAEIVSLTLGNPLVLETRTAAKRPAEHWCDNDIVAYVPSRGNSLASKTLGFDS